MILSDTFAHTKNSLFLAWAYTATTSRKYLKDNVIKPFSSNVTKIEFLLKVNTISSRQVMRNEKVHVSIGHFTVVYLVAKPLIWSEAEGDHIVIEASN